MTPDSNEPRLFPLPDRDEKAAEYASLPYAEKLIRLGFHPATGLKLRRVKRCGDCWWLKEAEDNRCGLAGMYGGYVEYVDPDWPGCLKWRGDAPLTFPTGQRTLRVDPVKVDKKYL